MVATFRANRPEAGPHLATLARMTALPRWPPRLLTVTEFAVLDEAADGRYELQEGHVVVAPRPEPAHGAYLSGLLAQLDAQTPDHLSIVPEVRVDLALVAPTRPGFVRVPDLVVVTTAGLDLRRRNSGLVPAGEVVLAVEIVSEGSRRTDHAVKHAEYGDAGIPHYWIVDIDVRPSLVACHHAGEFGYADAPPVTGRFTTDRPFPVRLDLDRLT